MTCSFTSRHDFEWFQRRNKLSDPPIAVSLVLLFQHLLLQISVFDVFRHFISCSDLAVLLIPSCPTKFTAIVLSFSPDPVLSRLNCPFHSHKWKNYTTGCLSLSEKSSSRIIRGNFIVFWQPEIIFIVQNWKIHPVEHFQEAVTSVNRRLQYLEWAFIWLLKGYGFV